MGKLIIFEGLDGSGKGTQTALTAQKLRERGVDLRQITFPNYQSDSSALVKMYLAGSSVKSLTMSTPMQLPAFMPWTVLPAIKPTGGLLSERRAGFVGPLHHLQCGASVCQTAADALGWLPELAVRL